MKLLIISPGKVHDPALSPYIALFEKRLSPFYSISWHYPKPEEKEKEGKAILSLIKSEDYVILLDENGTLLTTPLFSSLLERAKNESSKRLVFIIGGAYGVSDEVRKIAHTTISLSKLVFPHMLVRAILIEQIYRGDSLLRGSDYHHA